jgi:hypothetical protein
MNQWDVYPLLAIRIPSEKRRHPLILGNNYCTSCRLRLLRHSDVYELRLTR